jgi:RNA polymerase sigma factor (sigma-70 family)
MVQMTDPTTDAALITASKTTPECFGLIFDRYFDEIRAFVWRRLGPAHAEDVAAEAFARAFSQRGRFDTRYESARPWLFGIASNLIKMHARAESRYLHALARSSEVPSGDFTADADARASASATRAALLTSVSKLGHKDREVLLMHAWADLNSKEIGIALGMPDATVRTRLARGRKKLTARLGAVYEAGIAGGGHEPIPLEETSQ